MNFPIKKKNNNYLLPECQFYPMHVYGKSFTLNNTLYLNDILYCITEVINISKIRLNLIVCLFDKKIKERWFSWTNLLSNEIKTSYARILQQKFLIATKVIKRGSRTNTVCKCLHNPVRNRALIVLFRQGKTLLQ